MVPPFSASVVEGGVPSRVLWERQLTPTGQRVPRTLHSTRVPGRRRAHTVVLSDQAVFERALSLPNSSYDPEQFPPVEDVHCPDAVVGVLSALEELGQPGATFVTVPYVVTSYSSALLPKLALMSYYRAGSNANNS